MLNLLYLAVLIFLNIPSILLITAMIMRLFQDPETSVVHRISWMGLHNRNNFAATSRRFLVERSHGFYAPFEAILVGVLTQC